MWTIIRLAAAVVMIVALALTPALADEQKADRELKIGFVYVSPVGDEGWSYAHDLARQELARLPGVTTSYVESVPEGPDAERVFINMARKNFDIIFGTSFGYMDPMLKVAGQFPDTTFLHCSGLKSAPNMSNYFGRMYQARYLTGLVAGAMSKKNSIGYVAAHPIPEVIRGINAFTLGVRQVNPQATVRVVWTKTWYDPALEKEAAKSLLDVGVDVIAQHQDSAGPQEAAQERGAYSIGYNTDMHKVAPRAHLTAAVWTWGEEYKKIVEAIRNGTWKNGSFWYGMDSGVVDIAPYGEMVPASVREMTDKAKADIKAGKLTIFSGPIRDQQGNERVPAGKALSDQELLALDWFVEGVIGGTE